MCGIKLPAGLRQCEQLPEPIFTPATKEETGHDINISFERGCELVGREVMTALRDRSLAAYRDAADYARGRGVIIADTKFEWGFAGNDVMLIDEVLTPDSSRFWPADQYAPGKDQPSLTNNTSATTSKRWIGTRRRRGRGCRRKWWSTPARSTSRPTSGSPASLFRAGSRPCTEPERNA